jgi:hypothetical protein
MPRAKSKTNSSFTGRYIKLPHHVVTSEQWASLSSKAIKLLVDLLSQYNGHNNGMLSPCLSLMKKRGWASSSLYRAYVELVHAGFIVVTRQGYKIRGYPTLIATTWNGIDEPKKNCNYDPGVMPSHTPLNYWAKHPSEWGIKPTLKKPK